MNESKRKILGIDVSSSITGVAVMQGGKVIESSMWDTRNKKKFKNLYEKARFVESGLKQIKNRHKIDVILIEEPFMFFRAGGSSAKTMSMLQSYNGMISWICGTVFGFDPEHISVREARKAAGVSIKRGVDIKKQIFDYVVDKHPNINIEYTRQGNPKPGTYDMCDSVIIAMAGSKIDREQANTG